MTQTSFKLENAPSCPQNAAETSWFDAVDYPTKERHADLRKAIAFLKSIKLPLRESPPTESCPPGTFFPWVWIDAGTLVYRKGKVDIGQLLHEAGHLALTPPSKRGEIRPDKLLPGPMIGDLAVEAWDYYAAQAAGIFSMVIFAQNFNGKGLKVWQQLDSGIHPGISMLKAMGFLQGKRMVRWHMGEVDELQNLATRIALMKAPK